MFYQSYTPSVPKASLELMVILLPQPFKCRNHKHEISLPTTPKLFRQCTLPFLVKIKSPEHQVINETVCNDPNGMYELVRRLSSQQPNCAQPDLSSEPSMHASLTHDLLYRIAETILYSTSSTHPVCVPN